jgi:hypothetical protein
MRQSGAMSVECEFSDSRTEDDLWLRTQIAVISPSREGGEEHPVTRFTAPQIQAEYTEVPESKANRFRLKGNNKNERIMGVMFAVLA